MTPVERRLAAGSAAGLLALVAALRNAGIRAADVTPRCRPSDQGECPALAPGALTRRCSSPVHGSVSFVVS
jgi:hypothetical protein